MANGALGYSMTPRMTCERWLRAVSGGFAAAFSASAVAKWKPSFAAVLLAVISSTGAASAQASSHAHLPSGRPQILDTLRLPVRYQRVFGQRLAYYETGPRAAPVVILVHSLTWDAHAWAQNLPALAAKYRVIAIDPLGTGRSDKPLIDYKMDTWTDGFSEFMRLKGIQRAAFVGAVMGGALAVHMALEHPEQVRALVVAASNTGPGPHEGGARTPPPGPSLAGARQSLLEAFHDSTLVTDSLVRAWFTRRLAAGDGYTIQRHLADHRARYMVEELQRIQVPALFPWCREDRTTPLSWGEDYAKALPAGELAVIDRCGHYPNLEQPAAFNRTVLDFLEKHVGSASDSPKGQ